VSAVRLVVRRVRAATLAGLVVAAGVGWAGRARADALSDLEKAHSAYVAHKYEDAENRLRALLDPRTGALKDPDNVADARMYLGAALLAENKKSEAAAVFEQLLRDKPDYQPDPLRVTLQATDALIDARSRMREELAASLAEKVRQAMEEKARIEAERQRAALRLAMLEKLAGEETVVHTNSRWFALVPFGVGQFQNGQTALGGVFLATQSLALVGSLVGQIELLYYENQMNDAVRGGSAMASQAYHDRAFASYLVTNIFSASFAVLAIAGIVHAQITFVPERIEVRHRDLPPVSWTPWLAPLTGREGGGGAVFGLRGTF
jgi:hypothetical protein